MSRAPSSRYVAVYCSSGILSSMVPANRKDQMRARATRPASFEDSVSEFREFLRKNDYPEKVAWVEPGDVLLSGFRLIYVRVPIPRTNEQHVRQLFDLSQSSYIGILFGTICAIKDTTYANAWMPRDAGEAERRLMSDGLKMSAKTGIGRIPGETVRSLLRWSYLRLKLWRRQRQKDQLFC